MAHRDTADGFNPVLGIQLSQTYITAGVKLLDDHVLGQLDLFAAEISTPKMKPPPVASDRGVAVPYCGFKLGQCLLSNATRHSEAFY